MMTSDMESRFECLRLALGTMPIHGVVPEGYKSETILEVAAKYYAFVNRTGEQSAATGVYA